MVYLQTFGVHGCDLANAVPYQSPKATDGLSFPSNFYVVWNDCSIYSVHGSTLAHGFSVFRSETPLP
ncbi:hypothetical protein D9757_015331 [Collybiopsis confluens]|uniref:Uncharacterized protein n=1 Tax=Collybiopsis confluens TaxID=2823264 RepID=A0A8H5FJQ0_9AGAR|nr:hypothetical protein D9757_015331 [Collybiopsis confluens]